MCGDLVFEISCPCHISLCSGGGGDVWCSWGPMPVVTCGLVIMVGLSTIGGLAGLLGSVGV